MCNERLAPSRFALSVLMSVVLMLALAGNARAGARETVPYRFAGGTDGLYPFGSLVMDSEGNLYGTTEEGGTPNPHCRSLCGTVFELSPNGATWTKTTLYTFMGSDDGNFPAAGLVLDNQGNLYGTTYFGGEQYAGTVFELKRTSSGWRKETLHRFNGTDGAWPDAGLVIDTQGNLLGTTLTGGTAGGYGGTVFKLSPGPTGWTSTVLHNFGGNGDGAFPLSAVILDSGGNVYGTAALGGTTIGCVFSFGCGIVFELSPNPDGTYTENVLHYFDGNPYAGGTDGAYPETTPIFDSQGNLYGATESGGTHGCDNGGCGEVYKMTPNGDGTWTYESLYQFGATPSDGSIPAYSIVFDKSGNLYGSTLQGGGFSECEEYCGTIYELSPAGSSWTETVIFSFDYSDGEYPNGVIIDSLGRLYGTAEGGAGGGVVFQIIP